MGSLLSRFTAEELETIQRIPKLKKLDVKTYLHKLGMDLRRKVRHYICCHRLTAVNTPKERRKWAKTITEAIGKAVPAPYNLAWPVLGPVIEALVLEMLEAAARRGAAYCKGVSCILLPF